MGYLIELTLGIGGNLIAAEIIFHHRRWCQRIIRSAAKWIGDPEQSEIKSEEWLAALDDHVGMIASFSHAIGCWIGAPAVAAALRRPIPEMTARDRSQPYIFGASERRLASQIQTQVWSLLRFVGSGEYFRRLKEPSNKDILLSTTVAFGVSLLAGIAGLLRLLF